MSESSGPRFSIVVPVHNEADYLAAEIAELTRDLEARRVTDYELLVAENGSSDRTAEIAEEIAAGNPRIKVLRLPVADYGAAMKAGMLAGQGALVVNFDVDLHDVDFMLQAADLLEGKSANGREGETREHGHAGELGIVVGSKLVKGANDRRSFARHIISWGFTLILRVLFDPRMDDTHGMKVVRREIVQAYAPRTIMTTDLFDTELIIRARRAGVGVRALPVTIQEKRKPRSSIARRIPRTIKNLVKLRLALWKEKKAGDRL